MAGRLDGKIAIITGGARGQGEQTARLFVAEGARVVIADILDEGEAVARSLGDQAMFAKLDISRSDDWTHAVVAVEQRWGQVDILVNNAGIAHAASILELMEDDFHRVLQINLIGAWLGIKAVAPGMMKRGSGAIVNIVSTSGIFGLNGVGAYAASKWGLRGLTKVAALELGPRGVRVNSIYPGGINTDMTSVAGQVAGDRDKHYVGQPIQRIGESIEVAHVSLFLASEDASYMSGSEIVVDGGQTIGQYIALLPGAPLP